MALTQSALLAQGWAGLWSLTGGSFPASLVSFEWSVHVGVVTLGAIVSREWGHTRDRLVSALQGHPGHPGEMSQGLIIMLILLNREHIQVLSQSKGETKRASSMVKSRWRLEQPCW